MEIEGVPQTAIESSQREVSNFARRKAIRAANELARRQIEALRLYKPMPAQEEFHKCNASECLLQGGNRGGKSLAAFAEDARAVLNLDPYKKYPERDGVLAIVGYKEWHIGNVIYPYLFRAGAFKIIRDEETEEWRVYRPWVPQDMARKDQAKPAPPLIPRRLVEKIVWKDRGKNIFSSAFLTTGWEIKAFSSNSRPDQGYQADLIHIDEDVINPQWYEEAKGRLIDREGRLIWSALPHDDNDAIARFVERAETQAEEHSAGGQKPSSVVVRLTMEENPYLPAKAKADAIAGWKSMGDEVYRKRALGELITDSVMMYPMWSRGLHDVHSYVGRFGRLIDKYIESQSVPRDWCLRLAVDPGHHTAAAVFVATPPGAEFHLVYDEIYIHGCTAAKIAKSLREKTKDRWFQSFLIDAHGGNLTSLDTGISPREAYESELAKLSVRCADSGSTFFPGCSIIAYREELMRGMLSVDGSGRPQIICDFERCPNLEREMRRFRKKRINGQIVDTGNRRADTHAVECLEYLAAFLHDAGEPYVRPKSVLKHDTPGKRRVRAYHQRVAERRAMDNPFGITSTIILGPQGTIS